MLNNLQPFMHIYIYINNVRYIVYATSAMK